MAEPATRGAAPAAPAAEGQLDTVARLGAQRRKFKDAAKRLTEERDALKAELAAEKKSLEEAKKGGGAEEIAALKTQIREGAHKARFAELAKAAGVKEKALPDLWEKSGYKAEGDEPDEAKIKAAIEAQRTERDYLFEPANGQQQTTELAQIVPGPGRGQGGTAANQAGAFQASQAQIRDPAWCFQNQAAIAKAAKESLSLPVSQVANKFAIL